MTSPHLATKFKYQNIPPPPPIPSYLAPNPKNFNGYKLNESQLPVMEIPFKQPINMNTASTSSQTTTHASSGLSSGTPNSFLSLSQKLKTNQLVILRSEESSSHAVYYLDHLAIYQVDPPAQQSNSSNSSDSVGGSHAVYTYESIEDGEGLSLVAVAPCFLLLTRGGGRLTIFHATPLEPNSMLRILFDGSPLSPAPLAPHHATISSALLSKQRDQLFVVLYEFWEEQQHAHLKEEAHEIQFVHEGDALRTAGAIAPVPVATPHSAISSSKHALHKLTVVRFNIRNLKGFAPPPEVALNDMEETDGEPRMDLIHSFSSVQNYRLARDVMPPQFESDSNWSAPLACWLELPNESTHVPIPPSSLSTTSSTASATPPAPSFHWFVIARVPYLNETESVVYEMERIANEKAEDERAKMQPVEEIPRVQPTISASDQVESKMEVDSGGSTSSSSGPVLSTQPNFTSDKIVSDTHNLKHYAVDQEDDDADMDELGMADPSKYSLNPHVDAGIQLFDPLGNLLAKRYFKQHTFLFAQGNDAAYMKRPHTVVGIKQGEELLLYTISAAPQTTQEGLSLGPAGSVQPIDTTTPMPVPRMGIVLKPIFSYAGLGYVQSGKQFKKFFMEDGTHQFVIIAEYARHIYVYGRPSNSTPTASHWLLQLPHDNDPDSDDSRQIYGLQSAIVPLPIPNASSDESTPTPIQGQPILYVLTRRSCRQYRLPLVPLPP